MLENPMSNRIAFQYLNNEATSVEAWFDKWENQYQVVEHRFDEGYVNHVFLICTDEAKEDAPQEFLLHQPRWSEEGISGI